MRFIIKMVILIVAFSTCSRQEFEPKNDYPVRPVPFTQVQINDSFWSPRLEANRRVTIPYDFEKSEETYRINNFAVAGGLKEGEHIGRRYNDSDVFKIMEGAAYSLAIHPDSELEKYLDDLIAKIAAAQEEDGYLYTMRTINPDKVSENAGEERWSYIAQSHELYNVGHMYEAAVAHYRATGKRNFLDVAIRNANLICDTFGPNKRKDPPGHQEIEIGLAKLYRVTGDKKYIELAKFFLDQRGNKDGHKLYGEYSQDHKPVVEQEKAVGHAVRAAYMYSGMADIAALTGDEKYIEAIDKIWENVVSKKLYITGGIGAEHRGEAFGENYELPNLSAYNETCAAIANMMWNHRLFLLHGDAKYMDVVERTLYNGFLSGVSFSGDKFFYPNPLESDGNYQRSPWFDCSCCPTNVARFLPSLPGYIYAYKNNNLYVSLFISGTCTVEMNNNKVKLKQETNYPWDGKIKITVEPEKRKKFGIYVRIPGWTRNKPVPSDLYYYMNTIKETPTLKINNSEIGIDLHKGFAVIKKDWEKGDIIELTLPTQIRRVLSNERVKADIGKTSLERGPVVYCAEGIDNGGHARNLILPDDTKLKAKHREDLLNGVTVIRGEAKAVYTKLKDKKTVVKTQELTAIPYYSWAHRGPGEMVVWFPRTEKYANPLQPPTIASKSKPSASHVFAYDAVAAMNNQDNPKSSDDHSISRFTWWNHTGTSEWVQYDFEKPESVSKVEVYWFDDTPQGGCKLPESWTVLYRDGSEWKPVNNIDKYVIEKDKFNIVQFEPVKTTALRLSVKLKEGYSAGILEWKVE